MRALVVLAAVVRIAHADTDLCAPGSRHHGAAIDLDVKRADIHDVFRLLADAAHMNLVIASDVAGQVTVRLLRVPWDAAACAIAASQRLRVTLDGDVLMVRRPAS